MTVIENQLAISSCLFLPIPSYFFFFFLNKFEVEMFLLNFDQL